MILNPVIAGSAEEKVYKITDESGFGFPKSAKAGEIVATEMLSTIGTIVVTAKNGTRIPFSNGQLSRGEFIFVMPAQDVRIYEE